MSKTNKILIGSVSTLCIVGTLTLLKAVFNDGGQMITDWISALSNATMAGAAIYAAYKAKQWFSQLSYTTAFNKAAEVLVNIDNSIGVRADTYMEMNKMHFEMQNILDGTTMPTNELIDELQKRVDFYDRNISSLVKLKNDYSVLKRWPIKIHNSELVDGLINKLIQNKTRCITVIELSMCIIEDFLRTGGTNRETLFSDFITALVQFNALHSEVDVLYKEFNENSFADYFS